MDVLTTTFPLHLRRIGMTDNEYMEMIEAEWIDPSDSTDLFDDVNCFEDVTE